MQKDYTTNDNTMNSVELYEDIINRLNKIEHMLSEMLTPEEEKVVRMVYGLDNVELSVKGSIEPNK